MLSPKLKKVSTEIRERLKAGGVPARYVSVTCHVNGNVEVVNIRIVKGMETTLPDGRVLFFFVRDLYDEMVAKYDGPYMSIHWVN